MDTLGLPAPTATSSNSPATLTVMWVHDRYPARDEPEEWPFLDYRNDGSGIHCAGPNATPEMRASLRRFAELDPAPSFEAAASILRAEIRRDKQRRFRASIDATRVPW